MSIASKSLSSPLILGGAAVSLFAAWHHFGSSSRRSRQAQRDERLLGGGSAKRAVREWFSDHAERLFLGADLDSDGVLSLNEVYELVLKFYIDVNRRAPIPPPSRQQVTHNGVCEYNYFTEQLSQRNVCLLFRCWRSWNRRTRTTAAS